MEPVRRERHVVAPVVPGAPPSPDAAVWPMDAFRDRFFSAFSPG